MPDCDDLADDIDSIMPEPKAFTCYTCDLKDACDYAWDPYNLDGDCLANK